MTSRRDPSPSVVGRGDVVGGTIDRSGPATRFEAVVFDLDGVVADTEHLWDEAWAAFAAANGGTWSNSKSVALQGLSVPEWSAALATAAGVPGEGHRAAQFCIDFIIAAIDAGDGGLMPGAEDLVRYAAARVPIALATSSARPIIDYLLARHGLHDLFGATVSSAEVPRGKPSPDVYLEAARQIGMVGRPVVGIEDSGNGIRAARAAGLYVIAIPNRQFPPAAAALALADHVAPDHSAALRHLQAIIGHQPQ